MSCKETLSLENSQISTTSDTLLLQNPSIFQTSSSSFKDPQQLFEFCNQPCQKHVVQFYFSKEEIENYQQKSEEKLILERQKKGLPYFSQYDDPLSQLKISQTNSKNQGENQHSISSHNLQNNTCLIQEETNKFSYFIEQFNNECAPSLFNSNINNSIDSSFSDNNNNGYNPQSSEKTDSFNIHPDILNQSLFNHDTQENSLNIEQNNSLSNNSKITVKKKKFQNLIPVSMSSKKILKQKYKTEKKSQQFQSKNCIKGVQLKVIAFQKEKLKSLNLSNKEEYTLYLENFGQKCYNTYDLQTLYRNFSTFSYQELSQIHQIRQKRDINNKKQNNNNDIISEKEKQYIQAKNILQSYDKKTQFEIQDIIKDQESLLQFNQELIKINQFNFYNRTFLKIFLQFRFSNIAYTSKKILDKASYNYYGLLLQNTKLQDTHSLTTIKQ